MDDDGAVASPKVRRYNMYTPYGDTASTTTEELSFVFKSNCTEEKWMMMVLWRAQR